MSQDTIFAPMAALAFLTFFVLAQIPIRRFRAGRQGRATANDFKFGESSRVPGFSFVYAPLGFTMGPICAQVYSEHVLTGASIVPIAPFSPDR